MIIYLSAKEAHALRAAIKAAGGDPTEFITSKNRIWTKEAPGINFIKSKIGLVDSIPTALTSEYLEKVKEQSGIYIPDCEPPRILI
jgi:hypothetical protein